MIFLSVFNVSYNCETSLLDDVCCRVMTVTKTCKHRTSSLTDSNDKVMTINPSTNNEMIPTELFHQVPPDGNEPLVEGNPAAWKGPRALRVEVVLSLPS